jgi:hypothetical protein
MTGASGHGSAARFPKTRFSAILAAALLPFVTSFAAEKDESPPDIRMLDDSGRILLSRDGKPLAIAQLRPAVRGDEPVLSYEAALEALTKNPKPALAMKREAIREFTYPLATGQAEDFVNIMWRARRIASGARILSDSVVHGPAIENLAPGEQLPRPEALDLALEIFYDSENSLPKLTALNGERADLPADNKTIAGARTFEYEGKGGFRVAVSRSAPADWSVKALEHSILLRTPVRADPRITGGYGSFVLYLGSATDDAPPEISNLLLNRAQLPAHDFVEGYMRVYASGANPYVLSSLTLVAEVAMPPTLNGEVTIKRLPCYFWQPPDSKTDPHELPESEFRFRFAPPAEGVYGLRVVAIAATGEIEGDAAAVHVIAPACRGFVHARAGSTHLRFDDGSTFFPLGYDFASTSQANVDTYRTRFARMVRGGANCVRISLSRGGFTLESRAGAIDPAMAQMIDELLYAAEARGIYVILSIESGMDLKSHSAEHPYFREMGGPLIATPEFFRDVAAKKLFENRITYAAARFSAFRSVLAWELIDRVDESWPALMKNPDDSRLGPGEADLCRRARRDVQNWVEEMALHIKGMDQHDHPVAVSTSVSLEKPWIDLEKVEHLDWVINDDIELRSRELPAETEISRVSSWAAASREINRAHRPLMIGSFVQNGETTIRHNAIFSTLGSGYAGAPLLPSEFVDKSSTATTDFSVASVFACALSEIMRGDVKDTSRETSSVLDAPDGGHVRMFSVSGRRGMAAWLRDERPDKASAHYEIKEMEIRLPGLPEGLYDVTWMDSWTGKVLKSLSYAAPAKIIDRPAEPFSLTAPAFKNDVLLMIVQAKK